MRFRRAYSFLLIFLLLFSFLSSIIPLVEAVNQFSLPIEVTGFQSSSNAVVEMNYSMVVPALPLSSGSATEMYVGLTDTTNTTVLRTILAYGCFITATTGCQWQDNVYRDGYITYVSILNDATKQREQYPSNGVVVAVGDTLTFKLKRVDPCISESKPSWNLSIVNSTYSYTKQFCNSHAWVQGRNLTEVYVGVLEIHGLDICSELPNDTPVQKNVWVKDNQSNRLSPSNWLTVPEIDGINCGYTLNYVDYDVQYIWSNVAQTGLLTKGGFFQKKNATGTQNITGVGFPPKVIIFFGTRQPNIGFAAHQIRFIGVSNVTTDNVVAFASDDNSAGSNCGRGGQVTSAIQIFSSGTPTIAARAEVTSTHNNGFVLDWTANEVRKDIVNYLALGGATLTNSYIGTFTVSSTGLLNVSIGYRPDFLLFFWAYGTTGGAHGAFGFGYATGPSNEVAISMGCRDAVAANSGTRTTQRTNASILLVDAPNSNPPTLDGITELESMNSNGFRLNTVNAPTTASSISFLAIKGGKYYVGSFNQATSLGEQSVTGTGFAPIALLTASFNRVSNAALQVDAVISLGTATSAHSESEANLWSETCNNSAGSRCTGTLDPTRANQYIGNSILVMATGTGHGTATINAQADYLRAETNGFVLNYTTVDSTARELIYVAMGNAETTFSITAKVQDAGGGYNDVSGKTYLLLNGTNSKLVNSTGYAVWTGLSNGVYQVTCKWQNSTLNNGNVKCNSWNQWQIRLMGYSLNLLIRPSLYDVTLSFYRSGSSSITPQNMSLTLGHNSTLKTITTYTFKVANYSTTLSKIYWTNHNVRLNTSDSFTAVYDSQPFSFNLRIYSRTVQRTDLDNQAVPSSEISSHSIVYPNQTRKAGLTAGSAYLYPNGTSKEDSTLWYNINITHASNTFDATSGNPSVQLRLKSHTSRGGGYIGANATITGITLQSQTNSNLTATITGSGSTQYRIIAEVDANPTSVEKDDVSVSHSWASGKDTVDTVGLSKFEWLWITTYSLSIQVQDFGGGAILSGAWIIPNGTLAQKAVSSGWANYTGVSNGNYLIKGKWQNSTVSSNGWMKVNSTDSLTVSISGAAKTILIRFSVYDVTLSFYSVTPANMSITFGHNSSLKTVTSFAFKVANYSNTPSKIYWQNSNVRQNVTDSFTATSDPQTFSYNLRVYSNFVITNRFNDNSTVFTPTQIILTAPNSTQKTITSYTITWVQNGTWTIKRISYWGNNVKSSTDPTFSPTANSQTRQIASRIYSIIPSWSDLDSSSVANSQVQSYSITAPNSTQKTGLTAGSSYWLQNGTTVVFNTQWQSINITHASNSFDATSGNPTVQLRLKSHTSRGSGYIGINATITGETVQSQTNANLTFTPTGTAIPYKIIVQVNQNASYVEKANANISWTWTPSTIITISTTGVAKFEIIWVAATYTLTINVQDSGGNTLTLTFIGYNGSNIKTVSSGQVSWSGLSNGTYVLNRNIWQNSTLNNGRVQANSSNSVSVSISGSSLTVLIRLSVNSVTVKMKDNSGISITVTSFVITVPNNSTSKTVCSSANQCTFLVGNGTITPSSLTWQGSNTLVNTTGFSASSYGQVFDYRARVYSSYQILGRFSDGSTAFVPTNITLTAPNSTSVTITTYTISKVQNGTWTITRILYLGGNVKPSTNPTFSPTADSQSTSINSRIYSISFSNTFKDGGGTALYSNPSAFTLTFPNSTVSSSLTVGTYWIQNGTTTWMTITWQGTNIVPSSTTFDATNGAPTVNTKVYAMKIKHKDHQGTSLSVGVSYTFPNSTQSSQTPSSGWVNLTQIQVGTTTLPYGISVGANERYQSVYNSTSISLTADFTRNAQVYAHEYKSIIFTFKDNSGTTALSAPSSFTISFWNGTTLANPTTSSWIPTGTTTLNAVTWQSSNTRPQTAPSVSVTGSGTYTYNIRVYSLLPSFKDSSGSSLTQASVSSWRITAPNSTALSGLTGEILLQNGTSTISLVIYRSVNVTPTSGTSFNAADGNPTFNLRIYTLTPSFVDFLNATMSTSYSLNSTYTSGVQLPIANYTITATYQSQSLTLNDTSAVDLDVDVTRGYRSLNLFRHSASTSGYLWLNKTMTSASIASQTNTNFTWTITFSGNGQMKTNFPSSAPTSVKKDGATFSAYTYSGGVTTIDTDSSSTWSVVTTSTAPVGPQQGGVGWSPTTTTTTTISGVLPPPNPISLQFLFNLKLIDVRMITVPLLHFINTPIYLPLYVTNTPIYSPLYAIALIVLTVSVLIIYVRRSR